MRPGQHAPKVSTPRLAAWIPACEANYIRVLLRVRSGAISGVLNRLFSAEASRNRSLALSERYYEELRPRNAHVILARSGSDLSRITSSLHWEMTGKRTYPLRSTQFTQSRRVRAADRGPCRGLEATALPLTCSLPKGFHTCSAGRLASKCLQSFNFTFQACHALRSHTRE